MAAVLAFVDVYSRNNNVTKNKTMMMMIIIEHMHAKNVLI